VILQRLLVVGLLLQLALMEGLLVDHHHAVITVLLLLLTAAVVVLRLGMKIDLTHWWLLQVLRAALIQAKVIRVLRHWSSYDDVRSLS